MDLDVRGRVSGRVDSFQHCSDGCPAGARTRRGTDQCADGRTDHGWRDTGRSRDLSVYPVEERLPETLPIACWVFHDAMARRSSRRIPHGTPARHIVRGVLLDADGVAVCRGCDEPGVGRFDHDFRAAREIDSLPTRGVIYRRMRAHHRGPDCTTSALKHEVPVACG